MSDLVWYLFLFWFPFSSTASPLSAGLSPLDPTSLEFLTRYGYLPGDKTDAASLSEPSVLQKAIREVQRFGGIEETGQLDQLTRQLMMSKRCGVADIIPNSTLTTGEDTDVVTSSEHPDYHPSHNHTHNHHHYHHHDHHRRQKRYILASRGWTRRHLKYYLANVSPQLRRDDVLRIVQKALGMWAKYSGLVFELVSDPAKSDITFGFYRGNHGDHFPFDGRGSVLAHAFFPTTNDPLEGDVHFDDDEIWKIDPKETEEGIDLFTVTLHELGHSLGLSHSPQRDSVMNPYYKESKDLGYDDILAMHRLYVTRHWDDEGQHEDPSNTTPRYHPPGFPPRTHPPMMPPRTLPPVMPPRTHPPVMPPRTHPPTMPPRTHPPWTHPPATLPPRTYPTTERPRTILPSTRWPFNPFGSWHGHGLKPLDGCLGFFDTVALIRGELFIIKNQMLWRLTGPGEVRPEYPVSLHRFFHKLPENVTKIDAIYTRETDSNIIMFTGNEYWVFDGSEFVEESPKHITELGLPPYVSNIEAAATKSTRTYLFSSRMYWVYDEIEKRVVETRPLSDFKGLPPGRIDAALTYPDGRTYFFAGDNYWKLDEQTQSVSNMGSASEYWLSC